MDNEGNDLSLLQRPLRTAHTGFEEARRAYEDGTSEVRRLLSEECSLIYECNVCRNMFRSLANFISHKRVFCCINARITSHNTGYTDHNSTMIIQPTSSQEIEHMLRSRSTGCSPVPREIRQIRGSMRDLSGVIERLRREKAPPATVKQHSPVLQLESMPTSSQAVYQTIKVEEDDSIKTELNEVHHMLNSTRTIVGPDGKAVTMHQYERPSGSDSAETPDPSIGDETETNVFCEICHLTFQTHKTLELHIQKHHSSSAFVFQCPACSLTFLQAAAVIRHLSKDHKKPTRRIRMMRNTILKRRIQQGEVQPKGPSRELKRLQLSDDVVGQAVEHTDANGEQRKIMSLCIYCEKSFERRAALSTHLLNCRAKQEALAKPAPIVKKLNVNANANTIANAGNNSSLDSLGEGLEGQTTVDMQNIDSNEINEMFADLAEQHDNYAPALQTVSLDKLQLQHESDSTGDEVSNSDEEQEQQQEDQDQTRIENEIEDSSKPKVKKKRNVPIEKQLRCRCKICNKQFNALGNLRRHISMFHYRARRFGCTICDYRAFRRYDIVNHLGFSHKIEGDRDSLTEKYVSTHECEYSRDDVDGDIILLDKEQPAELEASIEMKSAPKTYEKPSKRVKTNTESSLEMAPSSPVTSTVKIKEEPEAEDEPPSLSKKRRKSRTQISPDSGERSFEKRPIRKRVKAVNKDFVYDLVSFKADPSGAQTPLATGTAIDSMRAKLRRQPVTAREESKPKHWEAYITDEKKPLIQGITRRIMLELVSQGRAVSATLPELPAERPQIRPRLTSYTRSDCGQQYVTDTSSVSNVGESFIEKIAKRTAAAGKDATISNLWNKVNAITQQRKPETSEVSVIYEHAPNTEAKDEVGAGAEAETDVLVTKNDLHKTPNGKQNSSSVTQLTPPSPPRKGNVPNALNTSSLADALSSPAAGVSTTAVVPQCLSSSEGPMGMGTAGLFPTLPKPSSVLQAAANGTIQLTLDSLLRAALQN